MERGKIYLDYNVFTQIESDIHNLEKIKNIFTECDFYYSVIHVEEYLWAEHNSTEKNYVTLSNMKAVIVGVSKKGVILKPSVNSQNGIIIEMPQSFDACYNLEMHYNTQNPVSEDAEWNFSHRKILRRDLQERNINAKNFSNLDYNEIWEEVEIKNRIEQLNNERMKNLHDIKAQRNNYSRSDDKGERIYSDEEIDLLLDLTKDICSVERNCFQNNIPSYPSLENAIEVLNNVLCECGYMHDKSERTERSGIYDVGHMIYATYCDKFVTKDARFARRAKAIYYYLGIKTQVEVFPK